MSGHHERDYIERTIATVRNHRDADNCWPQWANIFADEIEACWARIAELEDRADKYSRAALERAAERDALREQIRHVIEDSPGTPDSVKKYLLRAVEGAWGDPYEKSMLAGGRQR